MNNKNYNLKYINELIENLSFYNFNPDKLTYISRELKDILKYVTKNNIDYDSRYAVAVRELAYLEELLDTDENVDLTQYTLYMSLITDACNNMAHDCKNIKFKNDFFSIKGAGLITSSHKFKKIEMK